MSVSMASRGAENSFYTTPYQGLSGLGLNLKPYRFRLGPTKVLSNAVHCRSLSSIHILYHQALVGGLSDTFEPATWIRNLQLYGGRKR